MLALFSFILYVFSLIFLFLMLFVKCVNYLIEKKTVLNMYIQTRCKKVCTTKELMKFHLSYRNIMQFQISSRKEN